MRLRYSEKHGITEILVLSRLNSMSHLVRDDFITSTTPNMEMREIASYHSVHNSFSSMCGFSFVQHS